MAELPCPSKCENGRVFAHINRGDKPHTWEWIACFTCKGAGKITPEHMERIAAGQKMREERLARDESLMEAARRMGITPAELSRRERGG